LQGLLSGQSGDHRVLETRPTIKIIATLILFTLRLSQFTIPLFYSLDFN